MGFVTVGRTRLRYVRQGTGSPVLLVMGTGAPGRVWQLYQAPALAEAGFEVITFDNRGLTPDDGPPGSFTLADMVDDTAELIERLGIGPCALVGFSLGALIGQELMLKRPDLLTRVVLIATRGRTDALRSALCHADKALSASGSRLPAEYAAVVKGLFNLSRRTLDDDAAVREWLELFALPGGDDGGFRAQLGLDHIPDRLAALRAVRVPALVIGFEDDLMTPPHLGREVAAAIPGATYEQIRDCGHYGYLEQPDAVNALLLRFLG